MSSIRLSRFFSLVAAGLYLLQGPAARADYLMFTSETTGGIYTV